MRERSDRVDFLERYVIQDGKMKRGRQKIKMRERSDRLDFLPTVFIFAVVRLSLT